MKQWCALYVFLYSYHYYYYYHYHYYYYYHYHYYHYHNHYHNHYHHFHYLYHYYDYYKPKYHNFYKGIYYLKKKHTCHLCVKIESKTWALMSSGERFRNVYRRLIWIVLNVLLLNNIRIFQCMGNIFWVEIRMFSLKLHAEYLVRILKDMVFIQCWTCSSYHVQKLTWIYTSCDREKYISLQSMCLRANVKQLSLSRKANGDRICRI